MHLNWMKNKKTQILAMDGDQLTDYSVTFLFFCILGCYIETCKSAVAVEISLVHK